jgi:hypothetical protein
VEPHLKTKSAVVDELLANPRRLNVAHACLGLISMFVLWIRPGTFVPHLILYHSRYGDFARIVVNTAVAWMPYAISIAVSRSLLESRDLKATVFFIASASAITVAACGLYLGLFSTIATLSPLEISAAVVTMLVVVAWLGSIIWKDDVPDNL